MEQKIQNAINELERDASAAEARAGEYIAKATELLESARMETARVSELRAEAAKIQSQADSGESFGPKPGEPGYYCT